MSLRSKILLILLSVAGLYAGLDNGLLRLYAMRIFAEWELEEARARMEQVVHAFDEEEAELESKARIWASWSAIQRFAMEPDEGFVTSDLGPRALDSSQVDFFYICDPDGRVLWRAAQGADASVPVRLDVLPNEALDARHFLIQYTAEGRVGLVMSNQGPLLVCSQPIRDELGRAFAAQEAPRESNIELKRALYGSVILGRFVDEAFLSKIAEPHDFALEILPETSFDHAHDEAQREELLASLHSQEMDFASRVSENGNLHVFGLIPDIRTGESLVIEGATERVIYERGLNSVRYALISTLASALLLLFVLLRLLQGIVIRPLGSLTKKAVQIGRTDDTTIRVGMRRQDEIGQLSAEFDRMLDKLAHSRAEVVRTARLAGMSEIATGVLHNVGNVLNSVNVSANLMRSKIERLPVTDLAKLTNVLRQHEQDLATFVAGDPRGKHLIPFLTELNHALASGRESVLGELRTLGSGIDHVADLVRAQQTFAGTKGVFEYASLEHEVDAALRMCNQALGEITGVEIVREFEQLPSVRVDKHKLLEILVNLIQNARQSLDEVEGRPKRLTLRIKRLRGDRALIEVEDNGVGIPPENLTRIFHHGFTTKKKGHGFGLHVSANAATEMNAKLGVHSDGQGRGATFHLELSIGSSAVTAAA